MMGSFFRLGEFPFPKGHYLIYSLIDLEGKLHRPASFYDKWTKCYMIAGYMPLYLLTHPFDADMWKQYFTLVRGKEPFPHKRMHRVKVDTSPVRLIYGKSGLTFINKNSFEVQLKDENMEGTFTFIPEKDPSLIGGTGRPDDLYYYSMTDIKVKGQLMHKDGTSETLEGQGWFDHQWGRDYSLMFNRGWNWFGIQLDDGRELLVNGFHKNGQLERGTSMANVIEKDGSVRFTRNVTFQNGSLWQNSKTGAQYPLSWQIHIPDWKMELNVSAAFPSQEMPVLGPLKAIWEGACTVTGKEGTAGTLSGKAFMELVGYAD